MKIDPAVLDAMVATGCSAEQIAAVVKAASSKRSSGAERQARYRARQALESVTSDVTNRNVTSPAPLSDKEKSPTPPKEINSTPQATQLGASANVDFQQLAETLDRAADGKIISSSLLVIGPVIEMISAGVNLQLDIIPAIKATAARADKAYRLSYYLPAIREAYERRVAAGANLPKPKPIATDDEAWLKRLRFARARKLWSEAEYGPQPRQPGCRVPPHLIEQGDGMDWIDLSSKRVAA